MELNFNITQSPQEIESNSDDWYDHCSLALDVLVSKGYDREIEQVNHISYDRIIEISRYFEGN